MATTNTQFTTTLVAFLIIAAITVSHNGLVSVQGCQADLPSLIGQCAMYVRKVNPRLNPSPSCCRVVVRVDIPCICNFITSEIERVIDMEKVTYVAAYCSKALTSGTKCGSYIVPGSTGDDDRENKAPVPGVEEDESPGPSVENGEVPCPSVEDGGEASIPRIDVMPWMPWIIRDPKN